MKDEWYFRQLDQAFERKLSRADEAREKIAAHRVKVERWRAVLGNAGVNNIDELINKELDEYARSEEYRQRNDDAGHGFDEE
jgi:hypothetical protein